MYLMYCSYHTTTRAAARCTNCTRPLCSGCDHRIRGYPYCQDCIVEGISNLSRSKQSDQTSKGRARLAALFAALLPGMGAVYNKQNIKAVAHFVGVVGLFQLRHLRPFGGFFVLASIASYIFTIVDAYRTGKLIAGGESAEADEERFKRALSRRAPAVGIGMIVVGLLAVLQMLLPSGVTISTQSLIAVGLVLLGGYLLTAFLKKQPESDSNDSSRSFPFSLVTGGAKTSIQKDSRQQRWR